LRGNFEHHALLIEAKGLFSWILVGPEVVALAAGGAEGVLELILALLALDFHQFVIFTRGQAEQGRTSVTRHHRGLEAAEAIVHLA
jgi:hypothetical protein